MSAAQAAGELRRGLLLVAGVSLFVQAGALVVPIYDMHLFDTVLQSASLDTLAALSLACIAGLVLFGLVMWLRAAALQLLGERLAARLSGPVLEAGLCRSLAGDPRAGAEALRDLHALRHFLGSPAATVPFDLLGTPLLLGVLFLMHPTLFWLGVAGIGLMLAVAIMVDRAGAAPLQDAHEAEARGAHEVAIALADRDLSEGVGLQDAVRRRHLAREAEAAAAADRAHRRAEAWAASGRCVRHAMQGCLIALGALLVLRHEASPAVLIGANLLFAMLLAPLDQVMQAWRQATAARLAWQRIARLLRDGAPLHAAANDDGAAPEAADGLVVRDLSVQAGQACLLEGVSFTLAPGRMLLLRGASGAGKSTLLRALAGVTDPARGQVRLDGVPIAQVDRARLLGYLPGRVQLTEGTVLDVIGRFGAAGSEAVVAAAERAGIHARIGRLPQGYGTPIGPGTPLLSGGEKQRIGLARALCGAPRLLLLDEPDASLDQAGEAALLAALRGALAGGAIVVAATHRPGLAALADWELRLESGRASGLVRLAHAPIAVAG